MQKIKGIFVLIWNWAPAKFEKGTVAESCYRAPSQHRNCGCKASWKPISRFENLGNPAQKAGLFLHLGNRNSATWWKQLSTTDNLSRKYQTFWEKTLTKKCTSNCQLYLQSISAFWEQLGFSRRLRKLWEKLQLLSCRSFGSYGESPPCCNTRAPNRPSPAYGWHPVGQVPRRTSPRQSRRIHTPPGQQRDGALPLPWIGRDLSALPG